MIVALLLMLQAWSDPSALLTLTVDGDAIYTRPHTITVTAVGPLSPTGEHVWAATRTSEVGRETVTSNDCPALGQAVREFGDLPPVPLYPPVLAAASESRPVPPTIKDGFSTSLSLRTVTADGSSAEVTVRWGNAYQRWGHRTVSGLIACWGPLTPQAG